MIARRIVFFLHSNLRNGANLVMLRHAGHLRRLGHDVHVVFQHRFFDRSIEFADLPTPPSTWFIDEWRQAARLPTDITIVNWWECAYAIQDAPARLYAYCRHGDERLMYRSDVFASLFDQIDRERFRWYCVSDALAAPLRALGHAPMVLPPGVDVSAFATAAPSLPPCARALRVLVEGPVDAAIKRVGATVGMLRDLGSVEIVHMAADGSRAEGADIALGAVSHAATAGVFASCDLIVKLSAQESFAMPVLEQFAAGGTAVVTRFPGCEAYIRDGENALVVDSAEPFAPARAAVAGLLEAPARLVALRNAARATAAAFDWPGLHARFAADLLAGLETVPRSGQILPVVEANRYRFVETFERWVRSEGRDVR